MTEGISHTAPRSLLERVAQELVDDGYEAILHPAPYLLPAEIARFQPDILARRGEENVAVAVRQVPDPASSPQVQGLAEAVRSHPGWHFRLATAPRLEPVTPWSPEEAAARIDEAQQLHTHGHPDAALLLLLAAAEAIGRWLADHDGLGEARWSPRTLFGGLIHRGLIDRGDAELLERAQRLRNLVVHGARGEPGTEIDIPDLVAAVRRLLAEVDLSRSERVSATVL